MRKGIILLAILSVVLGVSVSTNAAMRSIDILPNLVFQGTNATCEAYIVGNNGNEQIDAVVKLWYRNRCLETWEISGTGYLVFSASATVEKGKTYRLSVDAAFDGDMQPTVSISKLCE